MENEPREEAEEQSDLHTEKSFANNENTFMQIASIFLNLESTDVSCIQTGLILKR